MDDPVSTALADAIQLTFHFDAQRLRQDLSKVGDRDWNRHFNEAYYEGDWSAVALLAPVGAKHPIQQLYPDPTATEFEPTALLGRCPCFQEVLSRFDCPLKSVRLLRLGRHSRIKEHTDYNLGYEDGEVRLHIPLVSSPEVEFVVNGHQIAMGEGEVWYVNFNLPHRVHNRSAVDRVHLVLDCVVNDWLDARLGNGRQI